MIELWINGRATTIDVDPTTPLLWVLRDHLRLTGTKFGCGAGLCGACSVHLDGALALSCQIPVGQVGRARVTTIEGLAADPEHPVLRAWLLEQVPQCGYCQPGQIMAAAALLTERPTPSDAEVSAGMSRNICRCGTYVRIRSAIRHAARLTGEEQA